MTINSGLTRLPAAFFLLILGAMPAFAVTRTISTDAPATAAAGAKVPVTIVVATDAGGGEVIGFLYVRYSVDGGQNWVGHCFDERVGAKAERFLTLPAGPKGSLAKVAVMVAFRGGKAGDVDFTGAPIKWDGSWGKWESPPAKYFTIDVQ